MNALYNASIKDENSKGFAPFALPEAKSSKTGVSVRYARNYPQTVADYTGDILLVGIRSALPLATSKNYDKDTTQHECQIERWQKS